MTAVIASAGAMVTGCGSKKDASSAAGTASTGVATLTWSPNAENDLAGYNVYVGTAPGSFGLPISAGSSTAYQVTNLPTGQTYYFAVTAVDTSNNESDYSSETRKTFASAALGALLGQSTTYYVDKAGSDGHSCTQAMSPATAKQSLNAGIACLVAGDMLIVKAGTYDEILDDPFANTGDSWINKITVKAESPRAVIVKPSIGEFVMSFQDATQKYIEFDGIEIDATDAEACGVCIRRDAHHIRFKNSAVLNAANQGVTIFPEAGGAPDFNEFINVEVANTAWNRPCFGKDGVTDEAGFCHGFYVSSNNNLLDGVNLHHNNGYGVQFYPQGNRDNTIRNSRSHENIGVGIGSLGDGNRVINNVIYENGRGGLLIQETNNLVYHNTVYNNNNPNGFDGLSMTGTGHSVKNNLFFQSDVDGMVPDTSNLVGTDPRFVDAANGDFRLTANSAAVDAGIALSGVNTAIDGVRRPQGLAPDIGAYEFSNATGDIVAPVPPTDLTAL